MHGNLDSILETKPKQPIRGQLQKEPSPSNGYFSFQKMISPVLIKVIYVIGMIAITIGGLVLFFSAESLIKYFIGFGILTVGNLLWRLGCEGFILIFSIHDVLVDIKKELQKKP